jgi:hypothetical protein
MAAQRIELRPRLGVSLPSLVGMRYVYTMNWHTVIDERNWAMDQVIADVLRRDPAKLDLAVAWIQHFLSDPDYDVHSKDALQEWLDLIEMRGLAGVLEVLADRGEEATRMRQSSPFAVLMPQDERRRIIQQYEARRPRTHLAGV